MGREEGWWWSDTLMFNFFFIKNVLINLKTRFKNVYNFVQTNLLLRF